MSKRILTLPVIILLIAMIISACGGAATQAPAVEKTVYELPAQAEINFKTTALPIENLSAIEMSPGLAELLSGRSVNDFCASGAECSIERFATGFQYFKGLGYINQTLTIATINGSYTATQMNVEVLPALEGDTGTVVYTPAETAGAENVAMTVSETAAYLVKKAASSDDPSEKTNNAAVKLADLEEFASAMTDENGRICTAGPNGKVHWTNAVAAAQLPVSQHSLSFDCVTETPGAEKAAEKPADGESDTNKTIDGKRNDNAYKVCWKNGKPTKCEEAGITPIEGESTPVVSDYTAGSPIPEGCKLTGNEKKLVCPSGQVKKAEEAASTPVPVSTDVPIAGATDVPESNLNLLPDQSNADNTPALNNNPNLTGVNPSVSNGPPVNVAGDGLNPGGNPCNGRGCDK